jgi:hypothetical protein
MLKCLVMPKKILHSEITLAMMPVVKTKLRKCRICDKGLKLDDKMVVFDHIHVPVGYCCRYCETVYGDDDILINLGTTDKSGIYGEG